MPMSSLLCLMWLSAAMLVDCIDMPQYRETCPFCLQDQSRQLVSSEGFGSCANSTMDFKSSITTSDEALRLQMQDDGNLVLYDLKAKLPIWATMQMIPKHGDFAAQAIILDNGKFVVNQVNESGARPIWTSTLDVLWPTRAPYCVSVSSIPTRFGVTVYDSSCQVVWRSRPPKKKDIQMLIDA